LLIRVLIIGGTHFIGPPLVRQLHRAGHQVAVFHRGQTQAADLPPSVERLRGDRHHLGDHAVAFRRFAPQVVVDMIAFTEADARGLVETFRGLAERAVVLSSGDVYRAYGRLLGTEPGPPEPVPLGEDAPLRQQLFPYRAGASGPDDLGYHYDKILVERVLLGEPGLPATVLRLPMVHGTGDPQHRVHGYVKRMDDGRRAIPLDERMAPWRCTRGYVEDVAAAIALAVVDGRAVGKVYNVGEAAALSEADWVRTIGRAVGWLGEVVVVPRGRLSVPGDMSQDLVTDTSRIRSELGYTEMTLAEEALRRTVEWERRHPPDGVGLDYEAEDRALAGR
jgi:nucleoside-diphosphate-sugar epimerase